MKKYILLFIGLTILACGKTKKEEIKKEVKNEKTAKYVLSNAQSNIKFTAYKTTEKKAVRGIFKEIKITNNKQGNTIKEALNGAEFSIPVNLVLLILQ